MWERLLVGNGVYTVGTVYWVYLLGAGAAKPGLW